MRIATLLPSATEIVCALGLRENLVGISHSCNHPPAVAGLPVLTRSRVPKNAASADIDAVVRRFLGNEESLYLLDLEALQAVTPDLVISQRLCDVCAVTTGEVDAALQRLSTRPRLVDLNPRLLEDIFRDVQAVAAAAGVEDRGRNLVVGLRARLAAVDARTSRLSPDRRPRLAMIEWLDPPYNSGHWNPELVELAGAVDVLGPRGRPSQRISWEDVLAAEPDVILLSCCGFGLERTRAELAAIADHAGWQAVRAAVNGRVLLIDGDAYFSRPGPRVVDALEALAHALHPQAHPDAWPGLIEVL